MPLRKGEPVAEAIHELAHHGSRPRSHEQIVAIAESNFHRGRASGGIADAQHLASGGFSASGDPMVERAEMRNAGYDSQYHPGGFIASDTSGRTDRLPMSVAADSFVVPADVVSGLGQGNSLAGARMMNEIIGSPAPYGAGAAPHGRGHNIPNPPRAESQSSQTPSSVGGAPPQFAGSPASTSPAPVSSSVPIQALSDSALQSMGPQVNASDLVTQLPDIGYSRGGREPLSDVILAGGEMVVHRNDVEKIGHRMRKLGKSKARTDLAAGHEAMRELVSRVRKHQMKFLKSAPEPKR
ncbi:MAG TPA: hypothetical protein VGG45_16145 [Terracidiphilus sp.]|jgi:hypothetical protein